MNQYISLIEFKVLDPQTMIRIWKPEFDMKSAIAGGKEQLEYSKDQGESVVGEMFIFIFLAAVFIAFIFLAFIV